MLEMANTRLKIQNPYEEQNRIHLVTFYSKNCSKENHYRVANVYRPGRMGRTPSGTSISAHMAIRFHKKELLFNRDFIHESIVGTTFTGKLIGEIKECHHWAVIPEITAKSYLMGIHQFIIDPDDPFREGFVL